MKYKIIIISFFIIFPLTYYINLGYAASSDFRNSAGWEAGVDGSVALANLGAGGALDTNTLQQPIIGFVFGNKGLMVDISFKGSKITKIKK